MKKINKVVLAYSGGLDTSVIIRWLVENYQCQVVAFSADVGQTEELGGLEEKAKKAGASKLIVKDLKEEFGRDFILPSLKANAVYEGKYFLATALSRPLIAKYLVEVARSEAADAIAHGCSGKGNDQVRFEVSARALNPEIKIVAPLRHWELKSRAEEIDYAQKYGIPIPVTKEKPYSLDKNLWGVSIEGGILEDPWQAPPEDAFESTRSPLTAPDKAEEIEIEFEKGVPVAINGQKLNLVALIQALNILAGTHGIGRSDLLENRLVGIKSREIYEAPAATVLHLAHRDLENLTLDRETLHFKEIISSRYAEIIYYGLWFSPLREALDAFINKTQENVTGSVRMKLYKGNVIINGRRSPYSLYSKDFATYEKGSLFDETLSAGFVELWGLPLKIKGLLDKKIKNK
jgi:argininosuccinate synthase